MTNLSELYKTVKSDDDLNDFMATASKYVTNELDKLFYKIFGVYVNNVYEILEKRKCVITGSIILQILLNTKYKYGDIDIFYFDKNCDDIHKAWYFPDQKMFTIIKNLSYKLINEPSCFYQTLFDVEENDNDVNIMNNTGMNINGEVVEFICVCILDEKQNKDTVDLINLLTNKFDFNVCKNFVEFKDGNMICHFNDIRAIFDKKFTCNANYEKIYEVVLTHNKTVNKNIEPYEFLNFKKRLEKSRKEKYVNRGFTFAGYV